jgi:hypothetical protein
MLSGRASRVDLVGRRRHRDDLRVGVGHGPPAAVLGRAVREGRVVALGGAMLTVETDPVVVEERLASGRLACPGCSVVLARWGRARSRQVRDTGGGLWIVPRRARCTGCGATHVLLPVLLLVRRADTAAVIGAGLAAKAIGAGHRLIATLLDRPPETVRGCCGASPAGWSRCGWCSPGGVGTLRRIRCCPGRPGRRGLMRWPRSWLPRRRSGPGSASARCRRGRPRSRSPRPGCWPQAGLSRRPGVDQHELTLTRTGRPR